MSNSDKYSPLEVPGHDIVVIGASLGGFEALSALLSQLTADFPASLFAVVHLHPDGSALDRLLSRHTTLTVKFGEDGEAFVHGVMYLALPDKHLLLKDGHVRLSSGPKENRVRPAIDPLFRSAAVEHSSRVIGVQLTGQLDDGVTGLAAIKTCGGLAVVQEPADAVAPEMPRNALHMVEVDLVTTLADMGAALRKLVETPAPPPPPVPEILRREADILESMPKLSLDERILGPITPLTCPECGGMLSEIQEERFTRYRCHEGHAFGPLSLASGQWAKTEYALWSAVRLMEEQAAMLDRMARKANLPQVGGTHGRYRERAEEIHAHTEQVKRFLVDFTGEQGEVDEPD